MTPQGLNLQTKVSFLSRSDSYAERPSHVEVVETHMSWVFITDQYVYKFKKPIRLAFLDFSTLEARHFNCREEIRLNQRLAPGVYLSLVRLSADQTGRLALDGSGDTVEWLVKMRRLPEERMLNHAIRANHVDSNDIRRVSTKLAHFYRDALPVPIVAQQYRTRFLDSIRENREVLLNHIEELSADQLNRVIRAQLRFVNDRRDLLDQRVRDSRIIEGHGDLRPDHVCLAEDPVFIDCMEFNKDFRIVDPALELAYLAMECNYLGAPWIEPILFETYCDVTGDAPPTPLILFYKAHRAIIRAKLAIWHIEDAVVVDPRRWIDHCRAYLQLADDYSDLL